MPIAFPLPAQGNAFNNLATLYRNPFFVVPAPNLSRPGKPLTANALDPGGSWPLVATNVRRLGTMYANVQQTAIVNPVNTVRTDRRIETRVLSDAQWRLTGVSRDSVGAALGSCQVLVYRTDTRALAAETISDGSGNWTVLVDQPNRYFLVEYLAGTPDRFGTSLNTLTPLQV